MIAKEQLRNWMVSKCNASATVLWPRAGHMRGDDVCEPYPRLGNSIYQQYLRLAMMVVLLYFYMDSIVCKNASIDRTRISGYAYPLDDSFRSCQALATLPRHLQASKQTPHSLLDIQ